MEATDSFGYVRFLGGLGSESEPGPDRPDQMLGARRDDFCILLIGILGADHAGVLYNSHSAFTWYFNFN